jgi:LysW-gamma-L-lysine carboxypeptidase
MIDAVGLLEGLLAQYSPTNKENSAVRFLRDAMSGLGYETYSDLAGNAVGSRGTGQKELLLLGHIDTVPGFITPHTEAGKLYGRGAVDAKGPLACFVMAGAQVKVPAGWKITVIGAVGEEGDSRGAHFLCDYRKPPEMVVIGEPSGWDHLTLGYKGSAWVRINVRQAQTHSAARGASACERAVGFWNRLAAAAAEYNAPFTRQFDQITPSLRGMESLSDGFEDSASLKIGLRLPLDMGQAAFETFLNNQLEEGTLLTIDDFIPAYRSDKNSPLVRAFLPAIRKADGKPAFTLKTGTSDMNLVAPRWNCPILAYGPGDSSLDHTPEEHIEIAEYLKSIQILTLALENALG